ncbi:voltage-gated chloride channel family protein [bacterium SCSIO 12643]|nr:voltage-gated chloride channel family protein [bacterium SCSIO 12643]
MAMSKNTIATPQFSIQNFQHYSLFLLKWILIAIVIGLLTGSGSAWLLMALEWVGSYRDAHIWIVALLPIGGLIVGLLYHYYGTDVVKGNNQIIEEFNSPRQIIPFKMAPLVFIGTVITHLFGGSAGREGTAVQVGGAIADQFTKWFHLRDDDRKLLLAMGVSGGFASVFGTPLAGAVFALEVLIVGRMRYEALIPSFLTAIVADYACELWPVHHTHYQISEVPEMIPQTFLYAIIAGVFFGLTSILFSKSIHFFSDNFKRFVVYPPLRPLIGGVVLAVIFLTLDTSRFMGLGVPTISAAFVEPLHSYDFILKLLFTAFTIGAGFKGGEVTPLFFVGATLGNALMWVLPLPMSLLAGMGFVAVFAGATNTPLACILMGIELFGIESGVFVAIACVVAYLFSGHTGIYTSQIIGSPKHKNFEGQKKKTISELNHK